jgi:hypothetical protein
MDLSDFLVDRSDLSRVRWETTQTRADAPLDPGTALLQIERYSFTANNISYGVMGETMRYWDFFPAPAGWGRIPVWGYAHVVASRVPQLREGDRFYGYLPMSPYLLVQPEQIDDRSFVDASEHRLALPSTYQRYDRVSPSDPRTEDLRVVLRPLFATGLLIDDWLADHKLFGARQVLIGSASSKTGLATAFNLSRRIGRNFGIVALTSERNRAFCKQVGYYDRIVDYADIDSLQSDVPAVFVDLAGDRNVLESVHQHFGDALRHSSLVGLTHRTLTLSPGALDLPGPKPEMFFAPTQVETSIKTWGIEGLSRRVAEALRAFLASADGWMKIEHGSGREAIESAYRRTLDGKVEPTQGIILSL